MIAGGVKDALQPSSIEIESTHLRMYVPQLVRRPGRLLYVQAPRAQQQQQPPLQQQQQQRPMAPPRQQQQVVRPPPLPQQQRQQPAAWRFLNEVRSNAGARRGFPFPLIAP